MMTIFTDFDGTITKIDTLNLVLDEYANGYWREIEHKVTAHKLTEKEALQAEFDLVNVSLETVIAFLQEHAEIDPTFIDFSDWCKAKNVELIVLSGGFREFIQIVYDKFGIIDIPYYSNSIQVINNKWTIIQSLLPKINNLCNHCKTHHLLESKKLGKKVVYIGDGNTDRCPAENADIVFAKADLAIYLNQNKVKFNKYENFQNIQKKLSEFI
ncbi:MtnX-like HAD-IB family phosphatase [Calditrichota bacterium]